MAALPTLRQLQFFDALCRTGSFSRGAELCFVSQSTLSSGIKELEAILGAPLVDRRAASFTLTAAGEEVRERGGALLADARELVRAASTSKPLLEGQYRLGLIPTIGPFILPPAMPKISAAFAKLKLYLREDLTAGLVELLRADRLDMAVLALPLDEERMDSLTFAEDPFLLVTPKGHELAGEEVVRTEELFGRALLLLEDGHCLRDHALSACSLPRRQGGSFAATSLFTLVQMVRSGLGITLLPKMAIDQGLADGLAVLPLEDPGGGQPKRDIGLAWRTSSRRAEEAAALAPVLKEALA